MKKRKNNRAIKSFQDLRLAKEKVRVEIIENEYSIKDSQRIILSSITPGNIFNTFIETLLSKPDFAIKAGYVLGSFLKGRVKSKKRKRKRNR